MLAALKNKNYTELFIIVLSSVHSLPSNQEKVKDCLCKDLQMRAHAAIVTSVANM